MSYPHLIRRRPLDVLREHLDQMSLVPVYFMHDAWVALPVLQKAMYAQLVRMLEVSFTYRYLSITENQTDVTVMTLPDRGELKRLVNVFLTDRKVSANAKTVNVRECMSLKEMTATMNCIGHTKSVNFTDIVSRMKTASGLVGEEKSPEAWIAVPYGSIHPDIETEHLVVGMVLNGSLIGDHYAIPVFQSSVPNYIPLTGESVDQQLKNLRALLDSASLPTKKGGNRWRGVELLTCIPKETVLEYMAEYRSILRFRVSTVCVNGSKSIPTGINTLINVPLEILSYIQADIVCTVIEIGEVKQSKERDKHDKHDNNHVEGGVTDGHQRAEPVPEKVVPIVEKPRSLLDVIQGQQPKSSASKKAIPPPQPSQKELVPEAIVPPKKRGRPRSQKAPVKA